MQIEMTEEEYRDLLDVLHMAEWMMHAHATEKDPATEPYDRVIQKLYAVAKTMGQDDLIEYDADAREYFATRKFDDTTLSWEFIDDFTEETFWDELIHRLTDRDLSRKVGGNELMDKLSMKERFTLESPIIEKYSKEFEERGLDRLEIVEHFAQAVAKAPETHD
jgi:hypothetical protein